MIIWVAGLLNVAAMMPQVCKVLVTHAVRGLSVEMFGIILFIQIAFSLEGYFTRNRMLMVSCGLAALVTSTMICLIKYYQ